MPIANPSTYLADTVQILQTHWPSNRTINIVCHGHSVPAGYFATPTIDTFNAYPHLLHHQLKARFPFAPINVIVTAIGGENSQSGAKRFKEQVLCHRPDIITIDYGLNDRGIGLAEARCSWETMITQSLSAGVRIILLTPTPDNTQLPGASSETRDPLRHHAQQIRDLAALHGTGLVDSLTLFDQAIATGIPLPNLLSWSNHPNRPGHNLVAAGLLTYFPPYTPG